MPISESEFEVVAQKLNCDVATVKAVAEVECGKYGAFLPSGEPVILFERHKFSKVRVVSMIKVTPTFLTVSQADTEEDQSNTLDSRGLRLSIVTPPCGLVPGDSSR